MAPVAVLLPGEAPDCEAVLEAVGPLLLSQYHAAWHDYVDDPDGFVPPPRLQRGWEQYLAIVAARNVPPELQHIDIHEGHGTFVRDDERPLLTKELITAGALVGEADEVVERVRGIAATGVTELVLRIGYTNARDTMSRFARHVMPHL